MKSKFVLLIAIILGIFAAALVYFYLSGFTTKLENTKYTEVIVANKDIAQNTIITDLMLVRKKIAIDSKHPLSTSNATDLIGKVALINITSGEELLTNQVVGIGESKEGLSYAIPIGKKAMAIAIDDIIGVGGFLKPGDRIDIIATLASNDDPPVNFTVVVLQNTQILAVGNLMEGVKPSADAKAPEKRTVTLAVTTDEALKLKMAVERGSISLMLRPPTDTAIEPQKPVTADDILKK